MSSLITAIHEQSRPKLAAKARLRFDRHAQRFLLLYPERGLLLNSPAADILRSCTGGVTIDTIVGMLSARDPATPRELIANQVLDFLSSLQSRGLIEA
jgi:coenzyme PQQ biosynthesis protein PqqD